MVIDNSHEKIRRFTMADKKKEIIEIEETESKSEPVDEVRASLLDLSRRIMLAAVGAVVVAEEELGAFVDKLVERGELAEKDARKMMQEVLDRREKMEREHKAEKERNRPPAAATKADIAAINAKIAELTRQVDAIKGQPSEPAGK
jgi:polyhydroxyalkanoate synthesis regulator phasin